MGMNASRISMGLNASRMSMGCTMNAQHSQIGLMGGINNTCLSTSSENQNDSHGATDTIGENEPQYAPDDYGCEDDGYDNDGGDTYDEFGENTNSEFNSTEFGDLTMNDAAIPGTKTNTTAHLLDALCESDVLTNGGEYGYFNTAALEKITAGDQWMGSAHWKRSDRLRKKQITRKQQQEQKKEPSKGKRNQKRKARMVKENKAVPIQIVPIDHEFINSLLKKSSSGKKGKSDPTVLTKAARQKLSNDRNILSSDAGVNINHLTKLFMRPNSVISSRKTELRDCSGKFHENISFLFFNSGFD